MSVSYQFPIGLNTNKNTEKERKNYRSTPIDTDRFIPLTVFRFRLAISSRIFFSSVTIAIMLTTTKNKKKKSIDSEEEERMKAILKKPVDAATLANDKLRPWTVNPSSEGVLRSELGKLDKTIIITSPQMSAGDIGFSVLDRKLPEIEDFRSSFKTRTKLNPYKSVYEDYIIQYQNQQQKAYRFSGSGTKRGHSREGVNQPSVLLDNRSNANSRSNSGNKDNSLEKKHDFNGNSEISMNENSPHVRTFQPRDSNTPNNDDIISEVDTDHVTRIQKMIQSKSLSKQHQVDVPFPTVHYKPFKSPAVFPVSTTEYQKLRSEMQSFPKPQTAAVHLNHRNQLRMLSIVSNHLQHEDEWYNHRDRLRRGKPINTYNRAKSNPDIKSSYYHVPPPGSS